MSDVFITLYLLICAGHLWFCYKQNRKYQRLTKVMLMPVLLLFVMTTPATSKIFIIGALIFGFLGDAFLLYEKKNLFFIAGLSSFLIGHVLYIFELASRVNLIQTPTISIIITLIVGMLGVVVFKSISPYLKEMKIPVIGYTVIILIMLIYALIFGIVQHTFISFITVCGALCFVTSDYLLARSIFVKDFKHQDVYIMTTYLLAQCLLVLSFL